MCNIFYWRIYYQHPCDPVLITLKMQYNDNIKIIHISSKVIELRFIKCPLNVYVHIFFLCKIRILLIL